MEVIRTGTVVALAVTFLAALHLAVVGPISYLLPDIRIRSILGILDSRVCSAAKAVRSGQASVKKPYFSSKWTLVPWSPPMIRQA